MLLAREQRYRCEHYRGKDKHEPHAFYLAEKTPLSFLRSSRATPLLRAGSPPLRLLRRPLLKIANHLVRMRQASLVRANQLLEFSILVFRVHRHLTPNLTAFSAPELTLVA